MKNSIIQIVVFISCISYSANAEPIKVRFPESYPVSFKTSKGFKGMDVEVIKLILSRAGLEFKTVSWPFKRSLYSMKTGEIHVMTNLVKNEKRSEYMHWIGPVRYTSIGLIVLKKNRDLKIQNSDDLIRVSKETGRKIGSLIGGSYSDYYDNRLISDHSFKESFEFVAYVEQNYKKLNAGRIIGFLYDDFEVKCLINKPQKKGSEKLVDKFVIHSFRVEGSEGGAFIGLSRKLDRNTVKKIKASYRNIFNNGSFEEVYYKWCGEKIPDELTKIQIN
ncbi:MAG: amino acid ABC transporter substrate-binding protein [Deltaproteobacteria bacterium]|nr:amino acid ABC transporter substrate-binding protein [Deltaproteobacteria bacterium]